MIHPSRSGVFSQRGAAPAAIAVVQLSQLALVPAGYLGKVAGDPGNAVHLFRTAVGTLGKQAPGGSGAGVAGGEFR